MTFTDGAGWMETTKDAGSSSSRQRINRVTGVESTIEQSMSQPSISR